MPIYQYHCSSCGADLEIFQPMTDPSLTQCPQCQGALRKVFSPVGIVFKGSGFYATDSKKSRSTISGSTNPTREQTSNPSSSTSSDSGSTTTESSPNRTPSPTKSTSPTPTPGTTPASPTGGSDG